MDTTEQQLTNGLRKAENKQQTKTENNKFTTVTYINNHNEKIVCCGYLYAKKRVKRKKRAFSVDSVIKL